MCFVSDIIYIFASPLRGSQLRRGTTGERSVVANGGLMALLNLTLCGLGKRAPPALFVFGWGSGCFWGVFS